MTVSACVVGVDGGGSKTVARVAGPDGSVLGEGAAAGSNWETVGVEGAVTAIGTAVRGALASAGRDAADVRAAAFGLAGVDWPGDVATMHDALSALGLAGERWVGNDVEVALRAGCPTGVGIVSNVGTGTVTAGRNARGEVFRTMAIGWGEPSGASGLARDALHAIAAAHHGRAGAATALAGHIVAAASARDVPHLFEMVSRQRLRPDPAWARLVARAASDGDTVAQRLLVVSGRRHGAMVVGVASRLSIVDDPFDLVLSGSIHESEDRWFAPGFTAAVAHGCRHAKPRLIDAPPVHGAVLLALDMLAQRA